MRLGQTVPVFRPDPDGPVEPLLAGGYAYDDAEEAVWQVVSDVINNETLPHIAVRSVQTDPGVRATAPEGFTLARSSATSYRTLNVWRSETAMAAEVVWSDGDVTIRAYATNPEDAASLAGELAGRWPPAQPLDDGVRVRFWFMGPFGADSRVRRLACPAWEDIAANYPQAVRTALNGLVGHRPEGDGEGGRLILWHGPPGGGKSFGLRALAHAWSDWCDVSYVTDPDRLLDESGYLTALLADESSAGRWRLVVMEDSGEFVSADAKTRSGAGLGRLLNAADGLLGQGTRTLFLLTTNEDAGGLHAAITRPGRCLASVEFGPFPEGEASAWLGGPAGGDLTLAEMWDRKNRQVAAAAVQEGSAMTWKIRPTVRGMVRVTRPDGRSKDMPEAAARTLLASACQQDGTAADLADVRSRLADAGITLTAAADSGREPFAILAGFIGAETSDRRVLDSVLLRDFPQPFCWKNASPHAEIADAVLVGRIDELTIEPGEPGMADRIVGRGSYDLAIPDAAQAIIALANGGDGASIDPAGADITEECLAYDADGWCERWRTRWANMGVAGVTQCYVPAFQHGRVVLGDTPPDLQMPLAAPAPPQVMWEPDPMPPMPTEETVAEPADTRTVNITVNADGSPAPYGGCGCQQTAVTQVRDRPRQFLTAAAANLAAPPAEWFTDRGLDGPTPLWVTPEGQVYGHIAAWGTCHVGIAGRCVTPEDVRDELGTYPSFRVARTLTASGEGVATGVLTIGAGHADKHLDARAAIAHYDNAATGWADVASGEDEWGIWVAGAARPAAMDDPQLLRTIRGTVPSGDWRGIGGRARLIAVLNVNTPGFPVPQPDLLVADGSAEPLTILGYGTAELADMRRRPWVAELAQRDRRISRLETVLGPLLDTEADALAASIAGAR